MYQDQDQHVFSLKEDECLQFPFRRNPNSANQTSIGQKRLNKHRILCVFLELKPSADPSVKQRYYLFHNNTPLCQTDIYSTCPKCSLFGLFQWEWFTECSREVRFWGSEKNTLPGLSFLWIQHVLSFYERAHTAIISAISRLQLGLSVESVCCCCCLNVRSGPLRLNKSLHICEKIVMVHLGSNMINTSSFEQSRGRNHHFGQVKSIWTCLTFRVKMTRFWLFL